MPTLYKSILLAQPADGDTVFIRRYTRDPPIRAIWDPTTLMFISTAAITLTIVGGAYAGTHDAFWLTNILGGGGAGWGFLDSGRFLGAGRIDPNTWEMQQTDGATSYYTTPYNGPAYPATITVFNTFGPPSWAGPPTSMEFTLAHPAPLYIPATIVQAWRPI